MRQHHAPLPKADEVEGVALPAQADDGGVSPPRSDLAQVSGLLALSIVRSQTVRVAEGGEAWVAVLYERSCDATNLAYGFKLHVEVVD